MATRKIVIVKQGFGQEHDLASREATSLKQGLLDFYKETLSRYGYTDPKVVGNVLTVKTPMGERTYIAREA